MEYWADHPPAHIIRDAVHYKSKTRRSGKQAKSIGADTVSRLRSELAQFGLGEMKGPLPAIYRDK